MRIPAWIKIAASALLLAYISLKIDLRLLFDDVARSNLAYLGLGTALAFAGCFLSAYKWQVLLRGLGASVRYGELLRLFFLGLFYNLALPGQVGGEVVKGVRLARMGADGRIAAMSVLADRATGDSSGYGLALLPWLIAFGLLLAAASVLFATGRGLAVVAALGRRLHLTGKPRFARLASFLERGTMPVGSLSSLVSPLLLSGLFQMTVTCINLLVCYALGVQITFAELLWIVGAVALLQSLPISFAGIGVREGAYIYLLQTQGVAASTGLALSLIIFTMQVLMALTGGLLQLQSLLAKPGTKPAGSSQ